MRSLAAEFDGGTGGFLFWDGIWGLAGWLDVDGARDQHGLGLSQLLCLVELDL